MYDPEELIKQNERLDPDFWGERHFYIQETKKPIILAKHQSAFLRYAFNADHSWRFPFTTIIYSTVKKSGKTALAGLVSRWVAEHIGLNAEIYCMANDYEQAAGRIFDAAKKSIELSPNYDKKKRELPTEWRIRDRVMTHLPSGSIIKALPSDYVGEAGSNPSVTLWSELWGYSLERARRLWDEMTPPPTRQNAFRWVETYAGFEGESELLYDLYDLAVNQGIQLKASDLCDVGAFEEAQDADDPVPIYVNRSARLCALWDTGENARRMSWQTGELGREYYEEQYKTLRESAYRRLHLNEWVSSETSFIEEQRWDACMDVNIKRLPAYKERRLMSVQNLETFVASWKGKRERRSVIVAIDASVSNDCTALSVVARKAPGVEEVEELETWIWSPKDQPGGVMDYDQTISLVLEALNATCYIVEVAYDKYQLHDWALRMSRKLGLSFYDFSQATERLLSDKGLYDLIVERRLHHTGDETLKRHVLASATKEDKEESRLRIIKRGSQPIDGIVAISMAVARCLNLNL